MDAAQPQAKEKPTAAPHDIPMEKNIVAMNSSAEMTIRFRPATNMQNLTMAKVKIIAKFIMRSARAGWYKFVFLRRKLLNLPIPKGAN